MHHLTKIDETTENPGNSREREIHCAVCSCGWESNWVVFISRANELWESHAKEMKKRKNPIQTRSEKNGMNDYSSFSEAIEAAEKDPTIWEISFNLNRKRVRLLRQDNGVGPILWVYSPVSL